MTSGVLQDESEDLGFFAPAEPEQPASRDKENSAVRSDDAHPSLSAPSTQTRGLPPPPPPPGAPSLSIAEQFAPSVHDIAADPISALAASHWSRTVTSFDPAVVESIWRDQIIAHGLSLRKVMLLEYSQYLEKYLWPHFVAKAKKGQQASSVQHILSIVLMVNEKFRQRVTGVWDLFLDDKSRFSGLVQTVQKLLVTPSNEVGLDLQRLLLAFLTHIFQSLEYDHVRSEGMKLVSLLSWKCLTAKRRQLQFAEHPERREKYDAAEAQLAGKKGSAKEKAEFARNFFSNLIKTFLTVLHTIPESGAPPPHSIAYCERFLELMIDLEAQLPTRRHFNIILHDHLVIPICEASKLAKRGRLFLEKNTAAPVVMPKDWGSAGSESGGLFVQLLERLKFYAHFEIDDYTGVALTSADITRQHYERIRKLQKLIFMKFRDTLEDIALVNAGSIEKREGLFARFRTIDEPTLVALCEELGIRTRKVEDPVESYNRMFLINVLISYFEKRQSQIAKIKALPLYPDENLLFDETTVPASQYFSNVHPVAIPKLNLQYLTIYDYLLRNFELYRLETAYGIRQDIEEVVRHLAPKHVIDRHTGEDHTVFTRWARTAMEIETFHMTEIGPPKVMENKPSYVKADVRVNLQNYTGAAQKEWESLKPHDVLFLISFRMEPELPGWLQAQSQGQELTGSDFRRRFGIRAIRGCEVSELLGDDGKPVEDFESAKIASAENGNKARITGARRTFRVLLDTNQYQIDINNKNEDVYSTFNVLMRRRPHENNFKAVLGTIRDLMETDLVVPDWLHNVFLGYGDRASAHFSRMPNTIRTVDVHDTFLDWEHLVESMPTLNIKSAEKASLPHPGPPYIVALPDSVFQGSDNSNVTERQELTSTGEKRKLESIDDGENSSQDENTLIVRSYTPANMGPYPENVPKRNTVRFTPKQVEAIFSGMLPGLTMVVGPPGTGKTDVAVQIIANLYHNYPDQHTLIITKSNTALNQLFEKIAALDINPRHILRLGWGQEELDVEGTWGKYGRVNAFLEKRLQLLAEVDRLAMSFSIPGAHGNSCETAGYFFTQHVQPRWKRFAKRMAKSLGRASGVEVLDMHFPFKAFFSNAPQPLFKAEDTFEAAWEVAQGCWRHLKSMFDELEEIRAFELLRTQRDRSNYLLVKEARIIAMTCTHAALKRREFVQLGFKYDNVLMEESAQILEVETFIPLLLQNPDPDTGASRLKRVIMIGDHLQLPPVVKNMAFQRYGNMEQSMFARFVRLGVPTIQLDAQGRSRSSIAALYAWKYPGLHDLPSVSESRQYQMANPGFAFDYQLINVRNYKNRGETEPVRHHIQNEGEAEFVVATYQYMRLLGYPAEKITILTTYNGQRELILSLLDQKCSWNPLFGNPHAVATVDKYQGSQNDYILLSLVRTKTVGHLRDIRRMIVAMSRARLGLYIFCRTKVFQDSYELKPVFDILSQRPTDKLWIRPKEEYSDVIDRPVDQTGLKTGKNGSWQAEKKHGATPVEGVESMVELVQTRVAKQVSMEVPQESG
ncbi:hypothetical protein BC832DRAFT_544132 [Gaertneriomyces semiglobifer]|nr:hypothetical protein BC832DRAFT_544132 [Gaertneriomyces semiglobifer]